MLTEALVHKDNGANGLTFACHAARQKWRPFRNCFFHLSHLLVLRQQSKSILPVVGPCARPHTKSSICFHAQKTSPRKQDAVLDATARAICNVPAAEGGGELRRGQGGIPRGSDPTLPTPGSLIQIQLGLDSLYVRHSGKWKTLCRYWLGSARMSCTTAGAPEFIWSGEIKPRGLFEPTPRVTADTASRGRFQSMLVQFFLSTLSLTCFCCHFGPRRTRFSV